MGSVAKWLVLGVAAPAKGNIGLPVDQDEIWPILDRFDNDLRHMSTQDQMERLNVR